MGTLTGRISSGAGASIRAGARTGDGPDVGGAAGNRHTRRQSSEGAVVVGGRVVDNEEVGEAAARAGRKAAAVEHGGRAAAAEGDGVAAAEGGHQFGKLARVDGSGYAEEDNAVETG